MVEKGYFKTSDNQEIYFESTGSGPPLVFIYGLACLMNHWHKQVKEFSKTNRVIIFDLRGHHKSNQTFDQIELERTAKDIIEGCEFLKLNKPTLIGHSFGVPIVLNLLKNKPNYFNKSVLINGFHSNPFSNALSKEGVMTIIQSLIAFNNHAPDLTSWLWKNGTDNKIMHILAGLTGGFNLEKTEYKDIEIYAKGVSLIPPKVFLAHLKSLIDFDARQFLPNIHNQTLIIHGQKDGIVPFEQSQRIQKLMPNAQLELFPEGSHCCQLDFPIRVNEKIREFLS